jgi:hypothetical protein
MYSDTVTAMLTDRLGLDALIVLRRERDHPTVVRCALAEHLHDAARHATRREHELLRHTRILHDHLTCALEDLALACTPARWELVGASGAAIDQATARYGEAIDRLYDTLHLYTETATHLPAPAAAPEPDAAPRPAAHP